VQVLCFGHRISAHASVFGVFLGPRLVLLFGLAAAVRHLLSVFLFGWMWARYHRSASVPWRTSLILPPSPSPITARFLCYSIFLRRSVHCPQVFVSRSLLLAPARPSFHFPARFSGDDCLPPSIFFFSLQIPLSFLLQRLRAEGRVPGSFIVGHHVSHSDWFFRLRSCYCCLVPAYALQNLVLPLVPWSRSSRQVLVSCCSRFAVCAGAKWNSWFCKEIGLILKSPDQNLEFF
jgi:hypothetical protein